MAFFSESGLVASGTREKMRLCPKCGRLLEQKDEKGYCCPKGHGCWTEAIYSAQVYHSNPDCVSTGGSGHGSSSKGRKRKKPQKRRTAISKKYLDPYP